MNKKTTIMKKITFLITFLLSTLFPFQSFSQTLTGSSVEFVELGSTKTVSNTDHSLDAATPQGTYDVEFKVSGENYYIDVDANKIIIGARNGTFLNVNSITFNFTGGTFGSITGASFNAVASTGTETAGVSASFTATSVTITGTLNKDHANGFGLGVMGTVVFDITTGGSNSPPTVTTTAASSITTTSATLAGDVTSDGGDTVTERGIVYSTSDTTPTIAEGATKDTNGAGTGVFSESISSLTAETTYFFNSYAINSEGTSYGTPATFTTSTAEPTVAANTITQSSITSTTMTIGWTNGNGARRIVIAKSGSAVNANPVDATAGYSANASFGNGTDLGSSNFIVYDGTGTAVGLTGLTGGTTYHFKVIEFNGTSSTANYFLTGAPTSNKSTLATEPTVAANTITQSSITSTTMTIGWTNGNGARRIVIAKSGSAVNANPIDATAGYSANASFGNGTDLGSSNFIVYDGTGTAVGLTGLTASTTYHFKVIEFNGTSSAANYFLTGAPTSNRATIAAAVAPTVTTTTASAITSTTVTLAGNATADGGASITERGYVYAITAYNANPLISGTGVFKKTDGTGTGAFSESITDLIAGTSYSYKAYATNSAGTSYGALQTFTTPLPSTFPHTITFNLGIIAGYNMSNSTTIGEFTFSFTSIDGGDFISPDIGTNPKGTSSGSLYDSNVTVNDITKWTISKTNGTEFKLTSLVLKDSQVGASTSGTIKAYKDGSQVGSTVNIDFDGLKNLSANTDFENIDQIQIEATDINFFCR